MNIKKLLNLQKIILIIISVFFSGYIVHGQIIFNKLIYHDEVGVINGYFSSLQYGRWFLYIIMKLLNKFFIPTSTNAFSAFFVFLFISLSIYILIDLYRINSKLAQLIISIFSVTNVSVTMVFGYMFMAVYYSFSIFLTVLSAYLFVKVNKPALSTALSSILICFSIGIYQSNIVLYLNILLFYYMINIKDLKFIHILKVMVSSKFSISVYLLMYRLYLILKNATPTSYKNIGMLGFNGVIDYFIRIKDSYINFFIHDPMKSYSMFPGRITIYHSVFVFILLLFVVKYVFCVFKNNSFGQNLALSIMLLIVPAVINGIFIIVGANNVSAMNLYNYILLYILFFKLVEICSFKQCFINFSFILIILISVMLFKYIDTCYSNLYFNIEREKSFGNTLISRIQNTPGYKDEFKICFVEEPSPYFHRNDSNFDTVQPYRDIVITPPFGEINGYNNYTDYEFNRIINGFNPKRITYKEFGHLNELRNMPVYPDDGSIKIFDDIIVVKMEEIN